LPYGAVDGASALNGITPRKGTWSEGEEFVYDELVANKGKSKASYAKLRFCEERAAKDGLNYF
jgi:hypothetical protein